MTTCEKKGKLDEKCFCCNLLLSVNEIWTEQLMLRIIWSRYSHNHQYSQTLIEVVMLSNIAILFTFFKSSQEQFWQNLKLAFKPTISSSKKLHFLLKYTPYRHISLRSNRSRLYSLSFPYPAELGKTNEPHFLESVFQVFFMVSSI